MGSCGIAIVPTHRRIERRLEVASDVEVQQRRVSGQDDEQEDRAEADEAEDEDAAEDEEEPADDEEAEEEEEPDEEEEPEPEPEAKGPEPTAESVFGRE